MNLTTERLREIRSDVEQMRPTGEAMWRDLTVLIDWALSIREAAAREPESREDVATSAHSAECYADGISEGCVGPLGKPCPSYRDSVAAIRRRDEVDAARLLEAQRERDAARAQLAARDAQWREAMTEMEEALCAHSGVHVPRTAIANWFDHLRDLMASNGGAASGGDTRSTEEGSAIDTRCRGASSCGGRR